MEALLELIRHRGPDDTGHYSDASGRVHLGFVRLAIIDLQAGNQPVCNEDGDVVGILNGEIYNYLELRQSLIERGHRLRSQGDAETIVHLYEEYGTDFLSHLEGMFSLALWDNRRRQLILARDHFGIKPLYYTAGSAPFAFATELKPLLRMKGVGKEVDHAALVQYLSYGYVLNPATIFTDIRKVRPGNFLLLTEDGVSEHCYWDVSAPRQVAEEGAELEAALLERIDRSVRLHLRSDVPVGAFLSGGIDSGLLVARAAAHHPKLKTYTLSFEGNSFDEAPLAALVAQRYDTDHTTFTVSPDTLLDHLADMVWSCDEPLADSGLLPNFLINKLAAAQGVKVVLNGAGGDELFGGYSYYFPTPLERRLLAFPRSLALAAGAASLFHREAGRKLQRCSSYPQDPFSHYLGHVTVWTHHDVSQLLNRPLPSDSARRHWCERFSGDSLNARLYSDIKTYLTDDLMLLLDRTTMAHSIEGRVPFLNHPLAEFAMGIAAGQKAPGDVRKHLLKETARPFLPAQLFDQPKMGFCSPIAKWMSGPLGELAEKMLKSDRCTRRPFWNREGMLKFASDPRARLRFSHRYYTLFMLEVFFRVHCDNEFDSFPALPLKDLL